MKKLHLLTLLSFTLISEAYSQSNWAQEENNLRGRLQYYHTGGGNLGYSIRTTEDGGWAWQFVNGNNTTWFHVDYTTGNVGIGTENPLDKLDIIGGLRFNSNADMRIFGSNRLNRNTIVLDGHWDELEIKGRVIEWTGSNLHIGYENNHSGHYIEMGRNVSEIRFISSLNTETMRLINGNVGIGTTNPKNKLSVNGSIWAKEVKVSLTDAADWVFEEDYELRPLDEVEAFVKSNKHLPNVPSAEEFRQNDLNIAEMDNILLQKIEELTLYLIKQNKEIIELKTKVTALEEK